MRPASFHALQLLMGVTLALVFGVRAFPPLRQHGRLIVMVALAGYLAIGLAILVAYRRGGGVP